MSTLLGLFVDDFCLLLEDEDGGGLQGTSLATAMVMRRVKVKSMMTMIKAVCSSVPTKRPTWRNIKKKINKFGLNQIRSHDLQISKWALHPCATEL